MQSVNFQDTIIQSIIDTLKQEHYIFLYNIYNKYGDIGQFTFQDLLIKFPFKNICLYKQIKNNNITNNTLNQRCIARTWGSGTYKVQFDSINNIWNIGTYIKYYQDTNKWVYGTQCKRNSNNISPYFSLIGYLGNS